MPRALPGLVALALLLLLPLAAATHPITRDLASEISQGAQVILYVHEEGGARGHAAGEWSEDIERGEGTYDWTYDWDWAAYSDVFRGYGTMLNGHATLETTLAASFAEHESAGAEDPDGLIYRSSSDLQCNLHATEQDMAELSRQVGLLGTLDAARDVLRVTIQGVAVARLPDDAWSPCARQDELETRDEGTERTTAPEQGPATLAMSGLARDTLGRGGNDITFEIPLASGTKRVFQSYSFPLPPDGASPVGHYCDAPTIGSRAEVSGTCAVSGTLQAKIVVDPCAALRESFLEHMGTVRAVQAPPPDAPEAWVRAWGKDAQGKIAALLDDAHHLILLCGEESLPEDPFEEVLRLLDAHRDALIHIHNTKGLTPEGVRDLVSVERQAVLLGAGESDLDWGAIIGKAAGGQGSLRASTHSPVSLHAWTEDGRHVGWDDAAGAPEIGVEGATYEGEPGRAQVITLPPGYYKIEAVEIAEGPYAVDVSWNGTGVEGNDTFLTGAAPGRSSVAYYALEPAGEGETLRADAYVKRRVATSTSFSFIHPGTPSEAYRPAGAQPLFGPAAVEERDGTDGAASGDDEAPTAPTVTAGGGDTSGEAPPAEKPVPLGGAALVGLAAVAAARAARRR